MSEIQELLRSAEAHSKAAQDAFGKFYAEAKRLMAEKEAGPKAGDAFYYVMHNGMIWKPELFIWKSDTLSTGWQQIDNWFTSLDEATEIATQRNFITERVSAGDLPPDVYGCDFFVSVLGTHLLLYKRKGEVQRTFSTPELRAAFIEKWGGESEVAKRLAKGWV